MSIGQVHEPETYAERWEAQRLELDARAKVLKADPDAKAAAQLQADVDEFHKLPKPDGPGAPVNVPQREARPPTNGQLDGPAMSTCVYCETREGVDYDDEGRLVCASKSCQRRARRRKR